MNRSMQNPIESWLFRDKVILLFGARQVGKTTLAKSILEKHGSSKDYYLCEHPEVRQVLLSENPDLIFSFFNQAKLIVLDEAQYIENIGRILKILHDVRPECQIIATGSSSFDLANKLNEPLTGRAIQFMIYPLSLGEFAQTETPLTLKTKLSEWLIYGMYPGLLNLNASEKAILLTQLTGQYLYKDVLMFENLKNTQKIMQLLKLLALQMGQEVSIHELAQQLGISRNTVERFLDTLQKMFVIVKIGSFSRNLRKELSKKAKYYFYDLGIRNSILNHYAPLELRQDLGALWENFCAVERIKFWHNQMQHPNFYFWRTHDQQEIDWLEEHNGKLTGLEFKWKKPTRFKPPAIFLETYPNTSIQLIDPLHYLALTRP